MKSGELDREVEEVRYGPRSPVPTKLDLYKGIVRDRPPEEPVVRFEAEPGEQAKLNVGAQKQGADDR